MNLRIPIRRIRRVAGATAAFVLGFSLLWSAAGQILPQKALAAREGPGVYSKNYLLINTDTGEVLAEYGADEVLSDVGNFCALVSDMVTLDIGVPQEALLAIDGSCASRVPDTERTLDPKENPGEIVSVSELLSCMTIGGSKICGYQTALTATGGQEAEYLRIMNEKVTGTGLAPNTSFGDVAGMAETCSTTIRDMSNVFLKSLEYDVIRGMLSAGTVTVSVNYTHGERVLSNPNRFMTGQMPLENVTCGFLTTGETANPNGVLFTMTESEGVHLLAVVYGETESNDYTDTRSLMEYGWARNAGTITERKYEALEDVEMVTTEGAVLYELDSEYSAQLERPEANSKCRVLLTWQDWAFVDFGDNRNGFVKVSCLVDMPEETTESEPETQTSQSDEDETVEPSESTEPVPTLKPSGMNESVKMNILAQQIREKKQTQRRTLLAVGVAILSIIGMYVLRNKNA